MSILGAMQGGYGGSAQQAWNMGQSQSQSWNQSDSYSNSQSESRTFGTEASMLDRAFAGEANAVQQDFLDQQMAYNASEAEKNRMYQAYMSNTSYQRAVRDLMAAGLNPILAAGNSGASTPVGAQSTAGLASSSKANATADSYSSSRSTSESHTRGGSYSTSWSKGGSYGTSSWDNNFGDVVRGITDAFSGVVESISGAFNKQTASKVADKVIGAYSGAKQSANHFWQTKVLGNHQHTSGRYLGGGSRKY